MVEVHVGDRGNRQFELAACGVGFYIHRFVAVFILPDPYYLDEPHKLFSAFADECLRNRFERVKQVARSGILRVGTAAVRHCLRVRYRCAARNGVGLVGLCAVDSLHFLFLVQCYEFRPLEDSAVVGCNGIGSESQRCILRVCPMVVP